MDKQKVENLAKSFSLSCKQTVHNKQWMQKLTSPSTILIALTILDAVTILGGPKRGWTSSS